MTASRASCTADSLSASKALVASSSIRSAGCRTSARAKAIRWRSPPESSLEIGRHKVSRRICTLWSEGDFSIHCSADGGGGSHMLRLEVVSRVCHYGHWGVTGGSEEWSEKCALCCRLLC